MIARPGKTLNGALRTLAIPTVGQIRQPWLNTSEDALGAQHVLPGIRSVMFQSRFSLSDRQLSYVEALALPEMLALGYKPVSDRATTEDASKPSVQTTTPAVRIRIHGRLSIDVAQLELEHAAATAPAVRSADAR